ncbi:MAG: hypothetical protein Q4E39_01775 [bacterium]|nr:hypothetical protein [bacterium]
MKYKYEYKVNNADLKKLIVLTNSIYSIYMNNKLNQDTRKKYLDLARDEENKVYNKLEVNKDNVEDILERFSILLEMSSYNDNIKEQLAYRVENYLIFLAHKYPFKSTSKNYSVAENEDINSIAEQATLDYIKYTFKLTKDSLYTTKSKLKMKKINKILNNLRFNNKVIEFIDEDNISMNGRNLCLLLGHNKTSVDVVYQNVCINNINDLTNICLGFNNEVLKKQNNQIELEYYINCMRANLYLLNKDEISFIIKSFYDRILKNDNLNDVKTNSSISLNMMVDSIKTVATEKNVTEKESKKLKNNK